VIAYASIWRAQGPKGQPRHQEHNAGGKNPSTSAQPEELLAKMKANAERRATRPRKTNVTGIYKKIEIYLLSKRPQIMNPVARIDFVRCVRATLFPDAALVIKAACMVRSGVRSSSIPCPRDASSTNIDFNSP
jgi:hypothetical protein